MLRIKRLDVFILKSFCTLLLGTSFICLFIFIMQFLWRYVDQMVGKGLAISVLAKFFFYASLTLVPEALPMAILLASLITFGNFGERSELTAMKAAGISLINIMRPLIVFVSFICLVSFYFQNVVGPYAQTKLWTLLVSMKQKSPELDIPEGVFYDQIQGYNLYVKSKNKETGLLQGVLIYNLARGFENAQIIYADSGRMEMTADKQHLWLHLYNGEEFENLREQSVNTTNAVPYRRESFAEKHAIIEFDSDFNMVDEGFMGNQYQSKNMIELRHDADSMQVKMDSITHKYYDQSKSDVYHIARAEVASDKPKKKKTEEQQVTYNIDSLFNDLSLAHRQQVYTSAVNTVESSKKDLEFKNLDMELTQKSLLRFRTAWHDKLTKSLACLIFLFIGAPLGGIIRKGGLGMPVVISVLFFIIYYLLNQTGLKMARTGKWIVWMGMWFSTAILASIGAFLTYRSNNDSVVLNMSGFNERLKLFLGYRSKRHIYRKEVIIEEPDYRRLQTDLAALSADCQNYRETQLVGRLNYIDLWFKPQDNGVIRQIGERLEQYVEEMSNTTNKYLLVELNNYPILSLAGLDKPFKKDWINMLCGVVFPVGLLFYFRIRMHRLRLQKDLQQVEKTDTAIIQIIESKILHNNGKNKT